MEQELLTEQIQLQRRLVRQLRLLNTWIGIFGLIIAAVLIVFVFFIYTAVTYVHDASTSISNIQTKTDNALDLQKQLCSGSSTFNSLIKNQTDVCKSE